MTNRIAILKLEAVAFAYGLRRVFSDISVEFPLGQMVGLIGPNGAGKSTLLRLLLRLAQPGAGMISLFGEPMGGISRRELAQLVSLVPQEADINYAFTVQEVVAMGRNPWLGRFQPPGRSDLEVIREAMRRTDVLALAARPVTQLSGGERQRVLIARSIAQETPVVLLDEPTANLDLCHQLEVLEMARNLVQQGNLVIAAIHDLELASRYCDRLLLLADGALQADGPCEEVLTSYSLLQHFKLRARVCQAGAGDERGVILSALGSARSRAGAPGPARPAANGWASLGEHRE